MPLVVWALAAGSCVWNGSLQVRPPVPIASLPVHEFQSRPRFWAHRYGP